MDLFLNVIYACGLGLQLSLWLWCSAYFVELIYCCQNFAIQYCLFFVILQSGDAGAMAFTHNFFKQLMWRSSKAHVSDELQIPPQEERVSWLFLSPIEGHFYQRQHETCVDDAREVVESFKDDARKQEGSGFHLFSIISSDIKL